MNQLLVGIADKTEYLPTKQGFLLIHDSDEFLQKQKQAILFDPKIHSFNPLRGMTYRRAREFASLIFGTEGKETITVRNGKRALTTALTTAKNLDDIKWGKSDPEKEAQAAIDDLLLSPLLRDVLCKPTNFSFKKGSSIVAKLNRAEIGDYDARILGSLLIAQFDGQIIVPDFGFYGQEQHTSLIRQNRLVAGVYTLSELEPKLRQMCLLMPKTGLLCTNDDALTLAAYEGLIRGVQDHTDFVKTAMGK